MKMNKLVRKASVAAIAAIFAGSAYATVDLNANTGAVAFASELTYNDATPLIGTAAQTDMTGLLGFGVSSGATRYIRISYGNAVLDGAAGALLVAAADGGTIVQGGAAGDNYVIYQFTAAANRSNTDAFAIAYSAAGLRVTSNDSPVTVTYRLHETAVDAVNGTNALSEKTANLATFTKGLKYTVTTNSATAIVADAFKKFTGSVLVARLGTVDYGVNATVYKHDGTLVTLADLVAATTNIVVTGDFGAAGGVTLDTSTAGTCAATAVTGTLDTGKTTATITVNTTAYNGDICYTVTGTTSIPAQTVNQALDLTAAAGSSAADTVAAKLGDILHDGAETWALNITSPDNASDLTFIRISNTSSTAHGVVTGTLIAQNGSVLGSGTLVADLLAGQTAVFSAADIGSAMGFLTTWTGRAKLHIIAEIPATALRVQNLIRTNNTLTNMGGDTSSNNN